MAVRSARKSSEGGFTTLVVVVLIPTVLLGVGALVLDLGAVAQERTVLRNGADAAVLAVVNDCLAGSCGDVLATAGVMADANADDGTSTVEELCGSVGGLAPCTNPTVPLPQHAKGHVRVRVKTRDEASGSDQLSFTFGRALGFTGRTVRQRSTMIWGAPAASAVIPLTFSRCEYERAIAASPLEPGPTFANPPQFIYFHQSTAAGSCPHGPPGFDLPGGYGWLANAGCQTHIEALRWTSADPGNAVPSGCSAASWRQRNIFIPVFDALRGSGANGEYYVAGFASIFITGYRFPSNTWPTGFTCPNQAGQSNVCIRAHFVKNTQTNAAQFGAGDFGTMVVKFVG